MIKNCIVDNIQPPQYAMDNGPKEGLICRPGYGYCQYGAECYAAFNVSCLVSFHYVLMLEKFLSFHSMYYNVGHFIHAEKVVSKD